MPRDGNTFSFVASFAEVEVDKETGAYHIVDFLAVAVTPKYQQLAFGFEPSVAKKPPRSNHQRRQVQQDFGYDVTSDLLELDEGDVKDEQPERGKGGGDAPRRKIPGVFAGERVVQAKHMSTEARQQPHSDHRRGQRNEWRSADLGPHAP